MAIDVNEDEKSRLGQHDDLGVSPETRRAETIQLEKLYKRPSASDNHTTSDIAKHEDLGHKKGGQNDKSAVPTPIGISAAESSAGFGRGETNKVGKGYDEAPATNPKASFAKRSIKSIGTTVDNHKKGFLGGGAVGLVIIFIVVGFTVILSQALINIENTVLDEEAKIERLVEGDAGRHILKNLMCRVAPCKNTPAEEDPGGDADNEPANPAEAATAAAGDGEQLASMMDSFSFTDADVVQALAHQGIEVNITGNQATGFTDTTTGNTITGDDILADTAEGDALFERFSTALPELNAGQVTSYRTDMADDADVSQAGLSPDDTTSAETLKDIEGQIDLDNGTAADEPTVTSSDENGGELDAGANSSALRSALAAVTDALNNGDTGSAALAAGEAAFNGIGNKLLIAGFAATACSLRNSVTQGAIERIPAIIGLLMRHGNLFITLADQLKSGKLNSTQVSTIMNGLSGDPSAPPATDGTASEATLPFNQSAAWFRDSGMPVTNTTNPGSGNYTPDISNSSLPTSNGITLIVNDINDALSFTGMSFLCGILTSAFGGIVSAGLGLGQIAVEIASCVGTVTEGCAGGIAEQGAITAGLITGNELIEHVVLPEILSLFTPAGLNGSEDAVQSVNNSDAGLNLSYNDYSRHIGAQPLPNSTADSLQTTATQDQVAYNNQQPLSYRLFSVSDPDSLASKLLGEMPLNLSASLYDASNYLTSFPSIFAHDIGSIFTHDALAATVSNQNPWEAYDTYEYGLTDSEVNAYDPVDNETWLFGSVSYSYTHTNTVCTKYNALGVCTKHVTTNTPITVSVPRIVALGDPNTYTINANSGGISGNSVEVNPTDLGPTNDDLLHCFVDGYVPIMENIDSANNNCGSIGQLSYTSPDGTSTTQPAPVLPTPVNIATIYCTNLQIIASKLPNNEGSDFNIGNCESSLEGGQVTTQTNDLGHFEQYLLNLDVMSNYLTLTEDQ